MNNKKELEAKYNKLLSFFYGNKRHLIDAMEEAIPLYKEAYRRTKNKKALQRVKYYKRILAIAKNETIH